MRSLKGKSEKNHFANQIEAEGTKVNQKISTERNIELNKLELQLLNPSGSWAHQDT